MSTDVAAPKPRRAAAAAVAAGDGARADGTPAPVHPRFTVRAAALFLVCVAASTVGGWFALRGLRPHQLGAQLGAMRPGWLVASLLAFAAAMLIRGVRWWVLFPPGRRPRLAAVTRAMLVGYFFNNLLPARAGEAARVVALRRACDRSVAEITGTVVVERLIDTAVLIAALAALSPWLPALPFSRSLLLLVTVAVLAGIALVAVVGVLLSRTPSFERRCLGAIPVSAGMRSHLSGFLRGLTTVGGDLRIATMGLSLTALSWAVLGVSFWLLMRSLGLAVPIQAGLLVAVATGIAMVVPSAPAALGVFEATTVVALRGYPVGRETAVSYALILHALNIAPLMLAGGMALWGLDRRPSPGNPHRGWRPPGHGADLGDAAISPPALLPQVAERIPEH
jgi:glycosyltransferase 2 family protein